MKKIKKGFALFLVFVMAVSVIPQGAFAAKKKVKLSKKAVTVTVGESVRIQLKNNKKKVKWVVASGKNIITLSKKKKTGVTIKGKKAGKARVHAKIGKKKYICKVTVKKLDKSSDEDWDDDADQDDDDTSTEEPVVQPTEKPLQISDPVIPSTSAPSVATPEPTPGEDTTPVPATIVPSLLPASSTPEPSQTSVPTIKPENHFEGLYAESEPFVISSVTFDKEVTSYSLAYTNIYVTQEGAASLKEVVPDVSKCTFTVYCYGKKAEVKGISDIVWNEKEGEGEGEDPYYSFALTVEQDGKEYTKTVKMMLGIPKYPNTPGNLSNGLTLLSLQADDKTYELERNVAYGGETYYFKDKEIDISKIAEAKKVSIVGVYEEETVTIDVEIRKWNQGYAFFINQSFKKGNLEIGSGYFYGYKKSERYFDVDAFTSTKGEVTGDMVSNEWCFVYEPKLEKGKSLKDIFGNLSEELNIYRTVYNNAYYKDNEIRNVVWHEESFYKNKEDPGYYTFDIVVTVDGQELTQEYKLVQRQRTYQVSGKLTTKDGLPIADAKLMLEEEGGSQEAVKTDSEGYFSKELIKGTYQFNLGKSFTVEDEDLQWNESLPVYKIMGKVSRKGTQATDFPGFWFDSQGDAQVIDDTVNGNEYYAYLKEGTYIVTSYSTQVDTITVTKSETHDITMELGKVFGKGSGYYKFVNTEDPEVYEEPFAAYGSYMVYLKPGTYEVQKDGTVIDTIEVTLGDMEKDYVSYTCKGELLDMKGVQIPKNVYNYDIVVKKEDKVYKNLSLKRESEGTSGYSFSALPGTYQFYYGEKKIAEVTVADSDVVKDLTMPVKYVKIRMYDVQEQLIPLTQQVTLTNQESKQMYYLYGEEDEDSVGFSIAMALPLGTYQFESYEGIPSMQGKTITVKEDNDEIVMNMSVYKLTGNCKINGQIADRSTWIDVYQKEGTVVLASCTVDDKGNYVFYLEPGEYTMKVYNSTVTMDKGEDVSIINGAVVKDLDITNAS